MNLAAVLGQSWNRFRPVWGRLGVIHVLPDFLSWFRCCLLVLICSNYEVFFVFSYFYS